MDIDTPPARAPEVLAPGSGDHFHFLGHLATVKVRPAGSGAFSVVEFVGPRDFGPPLHRHDHEDELFVVLDGELDVLAGDDRITAGSGAVAYLPSGRPHTFQVRSDTARFVCVTASVAAGPPRFDQLIAALGTATDVPALPEPGYIDATRVADVCREFDIEVLGPPPLPRS